MTIAGVTTVAEVDMIMRPAGEPRLDLGRLVGGIVVHDDMDFEPFGYVGVDLLKAQRGQLRSCGPNVKSADAC